MLAKVKFSDYERGIDVQAYTDGYACNEHNFVYLLSVAGHNSNVKAITSALVSGNAVQVCSKDTTELRPLYGGGYRIMTTKLPDMLLHQVLAHDDFFHTPERPRNLLYIDGEVPARLVYETVRAAYPVPLIPEWSDWLYRTLKQENHVAELQGTKKVLQLSLKEDVLDTLVSEAVANGEISF